MVGEEGRAPEVRLLFFSIFGHFVINKRIECGPSQFGSSRKHIATIIAANARCSTTEC